MKHYQTIYDYADYEMSGIAHGMSHVNRVLKNALALSDFLSEKEKELLIYAVLLHDIGREEEMHNRELDHAIVGAKKAEKFLESLAFEMAESKIITEAILSHRYRKSRKPNTKIGEILFDADKLDAIGSIGVIRAVAHAIECNQPIFMPLDEAKNKGLHPSNLEYHFKLKKIPSILISEKAKIMASKRMKIMDDFFSELENESI